MAGTAIRLRSLHWLIAAVLSSAAHAGEFKWLPVSATGVHSIVGNEIRLTGGGQTVTLELRVSDWDPGHDGIPELGAYQATLIAAGYASGSGAPLSPLTSPNLAAGAFIATKRCTVGGMPSSTGAPCTANSQCTPQTCQENPAYVFYQLSPLAAVSTQTADYQYGAAVTALMGQIDDGSSYYAGTLKLVVPATARGTYTIGFDANQNNTFLNDINALILLPLNLTPAKITVLCSSGADCNDANACTADLCITSHCSNPPNYDANTSCCDPADGSLQPLEDGNACTVGVCDPQSGNVTQQPAPSGTVCGGPPTGECDAQDLCNGTMCVNIFAPTTTRCGSSDATECDQADRCDGNGACSPRYRPLGTPCGNPSESSCDHRDTCDGSGACSPNIVPPGGSCEDGDFCTVGETCQPNHACLGGTPHDCTDNLPCSDDMCNEAENRCDHVPHVPSPQCSGDFGLDGGRNLGDYGELFDCLGLPGMPHPGGNCAIGDFAPVDGAVDLFDFAEFQNAFTGP